MTHSTRDRLSGLPDVKVTFPNFKKHNLTFVLDKVLPFHEAETNMGEMGWLRLFLFEKLCLCNRVFRSKSILLFFIIHLLDFSSLSANFLE